MLCAWRTGQKNSLTCNVLSLADQAMIFSLQEMKELYFLSFFSGLASLFSLFPLSSLAASPGF